MKRLIRAEISDVFFCPSEYRKDIIQASISTKDIMNHIVRVKSSNMWGYNINIRNRGDRTGDVYVQFKGTNGGPGDIYVLYDVPISVYRKLVTAPSKGHFYWANLRNNFKYSKLTGDKRGKLANAIN